MSAVMFAQFHDVRFPVAIGFGATGGPERRVEIVSLASGAERRNLRQADALRRYDAGTGLRSLADLEEVLAFFEARRGPLHPFRFRDPFDWKSCPLAATPSAADQTIGIGDGVTREFQLSKTYGEGADAYVRPIRCAVTQGVRVSVGGSETPVGHYSLDATAGLVRFATGHAPPQGAPVGAGFEFDVPVRFDTAALSLSLSGFKAGQVQSIPLREVRP